MYVVGRAVAMKSRGQIRIGTYYIVPLWMSGLPMDVTDIHGEVYLVGEHLPTRRQVSQLDTTLAIRRHPGNLGAPA